MGKPALKQKAYDYIVNAISSYEFKPGQALVEEDISRELGISRTPVREALKQAESDGLVQHIMSRGTFVSRMTVQDIEEIFQLREMFEVTALKTAIGQITEEELDLIRKNLTGLEEDGNGEDGAENQGEHSKKENYYRVDRDLHGLIVSYSGNSRLIKFNQTLMVQFEQIRRISSMTPRRLSKSKSEHLLILDALYERDLAKATDALTTHLNNIKESTLIICRNMQARGE